MKVLIVGSGGREHALADLLHRAGAEVYVAPGNPGMADVATVVHHYNDVAIARWADWARVDLVVIGEARRLARGLVDRLRERRLRVVGPGLDGARLEASKAWTKALCHAAGIPTARPWVIASDWHRAREAVRQIGLPCVIKADGLARTSGTFVCRTMAECDDALRLCLDGWLGSACRTVVIERALTGDEVSLFLLVGGGEIVPVGWVRDYKRAYDRDEGPNTGGMGAIAPAPGFGEADAQQVIHDIAAPLLATAESKGVRYSGVLYLGLMGTEEGWVLLEANVRWGDPEMQALGQLLDPDEMLAALVLVADDCAPRPVPMRSGAAIAVVLAKTSYPTGGQDPLATDEISWPEIVRPGDVRLYHAGTALLDGRWVAATGRVFTVVATGRDVADARQRVYGALGPLPPGLRMRTDIGLVPGGPVTIGSAGTSVA